MPRAESRASATTLNRVWQAILIVEKFLSEMKRLTEFGMNLEGLRSVWTRALAADLERRHRGDCGGDIEPQHRWGIECPQGGGGQGPPAR